MCGCFGSQWEGCGEVRGGGGDVVKASGVLEVSDCFTIFFGYNDKDY